MAIQNDPPTSGKANTVYKVMIVEDSTVTRNILKSILQSEPVVEVVGEAENGKIAIENAKLLQPDIILLDITMPEVDGITALPHILNVSPLSQVIMVSTITEKNAAISIKALGLGAADYIQKPQTGTVSKEEFEAELLRKIKALGFSSREKKYNTSLSLAKPQDDKSITSKTGTLEPQKIKLDKTADFIPEAIAIASSTGGPQALQTLFAKLKDNMPALPIFITQHMPPLFTKYLASNLSTTNSINCHEAQDGMEVEAGNIYLAPGNFHMIAIKDGIKIKIKLDQGPAENFCRPSADPMLRSLMNIYGRNVLLVVLTGMGQDGLNGAKLFAEKGAVVIAQDKASSVVWGMPGAICEAGIASGIYPINEIPDRIKEICNGKKCS